MNIANEWIAAQGTFDILGGIMYILVSVNQLHSHAKLTVNNSVVLESGIYVSHIVWRIRYRKLRKEAKITGRSIDDLLNSQQNITQTGRDLESGVLEDSGEILHQEPTEQPPRSTTDMEREKTIEKC